SFLLLLAHRHTRRKAQMYGNGGECQKEQTLGANGGLVSCVYVEESGITNNGVCVCVLGGCLLGCVCVCGGGLLAGVKVRCVCVLELRLGVCFGVGVKVRCVCVCWG